jgi:hypothetical protein
MGEEMMDALLGAPPWLVAAVWIVGSAALSTGLVAILRWRFGAKPTEHHNEVLGLLLSAVGIFCAIVVALVVFVVWDHLTTTRQAEINEGSALVVLYHDADTLPDPARTAVETSIRDYTASVIRDEFPALAVGRSSDATERSLSRMNHAVHQSLGNTSAPDQVTTVEQSQYTLALASTESMPPLLWALLIGACVMLLLMAAPLSMESAHFHLAGSGLLGGVLGAALFLILVADHPYTGPLRVEPSDLANNLHTYTLIDAGSRAAPAG